MSTHKKGVLAPATSSAVPSKKVDCAPKPYPDDQNKSGQAEAMTTETEETLKILKDKVISSGLDDNDNQDDQNVDDRIVDNVAQESVTPDNSQDINIKEEDTSVKDDAAEPIVQTDKKGNLIFTCNICHTYKGTVDLTRKYQEKAHGEYEYSCKNPHCAAVYKTKGGLNKHVKKHIEVTPTKCRKCNQVFQCDSEKCKHSCKSEKLCLVLALLHASTSVDLCLRKWVKSVIMNPFVKKNPQRDFFCTQCQKTFQGKLSYNQHITLVHSDAVVSVKYTSCGHPKKDKS